MKQEYVTLQIALLNPGDCVFCSYMRCLIIYIDFVYKE